MMVLFLGSSIGNFEPAVAETFLKSYAATFMRAILSCSARTWSNPSLKCCPPIMIR